MRFITKTTLSRAVLAVSALMVLAGCGLVKPVQPWEKGTLARPEMTFEGDKLDAKFTEHIYGSKEGASGGAGIGRRSAAPCPRGARRRGWRVQ